MKLKLHVVNAKLKVRNMTKRLVALTSQVYVHIPGKGCSEVSACFGKRNNNGGYFLFKKKTKVRILDAKANHANHWQSAES